VPAVDVLERVEPAGLVGAGQHDRRAPGLGRLGECRVDGHRVVPVDLADVPAEGGEASVVGTQVAAELGGTAHSQPVDVDDHGEVGEAEVRGLVGGLPHRAFSQFAVAAEHPDAVGQPVESLPGEGDPDRGGQALSEAAGRDLDTGQGGYRMAFQRRPEAAVVVHQRVVVDEAERLPRGVQQRGGVPFREHEVVVGRVGRVRPVHA
jgi:hypothetical protein